MDDQLKNRVDEQRSVNSSLETDPDVLAEVKRNRLLSLKIERWTNMAKAVAIVLQTFKAEAVSLVSGIGTLVLGWFQIEKWVLTSRQEVKSLNGDARPRSRRQRQEASESSDHSSGSGLNAIKEQQVSKALARQQETSTMVRQEVAQVETMFTDANTYIWFGLIVLFAGSSIKMWFKKRKRQLENGGK